MKSCSVSMHSRWQCRTRADACRASPRIPLQNRTGSPRLSRTSTVVPKHAGEEEVRSQNLPASNLQRHHGPSRDSNPKSNSLATLSSLEPPPAPPCPPPMRVSKQSSPVYRDRARPIPRLRPRPPAAASRRPKLNIGEAPQYQVLARILRTIQVCSVLHPKLNTSPGINCCAHSFSPVFKSKATTASLVFVLGCV